MARGGEAANGGRHAEPQVYEDHEIVPFAAAREYFLTRLPVAHHGEPLSLTARDAEVERLIEIGAYMVDRWAAANATPRGENYEGRRQQALDSASFGHIKYITSLAQINLDQYLDRKRPILRRSDLDAIIVNLPKKRKLPEFAIWLFLELWAGPVAAVGVILVAIVLQLAFPKYVDRATDEFTALFSSPSRQTSIDRQGASGAAKATAATAQTSR